MDIDSQLEQILEEENTKTAKLQEALQALWESAIQADHDFCGEQREWHLPRLHKATGILMQLFPTVTVEAMRQARTPYDDLVSGT